MSMVINLVEDHNIYLCEGGPVYNGGVQPTPITYLTQWKIVGNSVVSNPSANLPQGYKKCKYLEFHGTEYINSGVFLKNDIGLSLDLSTTVMSKTTIGARNTFLRGVLFGYHYTSSGNYRMYLAYGSDSSSYIIQTNVCDGHLHHIVLDSQQAKIDNENVAIDRGSEFPQQSLYIGTWNSNGTVDNRMFEGKMYSVRLYDSNGNLFNGIPCLDDNDVPCLYDTVSNTAFYNDGTGTFGYKIEQPVIYSCGDYSEVDGKYHILVQPLGGSIADIALDEPLRKVNDVADKIEFADGVATLTRAFGKVDWLNDMFERTSSLGRIYFTMLNNNIKTKTLNILSSLYITVSSIWANISDPVEFPNLHINSHPSRNMLRIVDEDKNNLTAVEFAQANANAGVEIIYELATPTTETIQVPQIAEADSYTCVISQGGKAVSWSSFETDSE